MRLGDDSQSVARALGLSESRGGLPERCPVTAVRSLVSTVGDKNLVARALSPRVVRRRTGSLSPADSSGIYRVAAVWVMAFKVFGRRDKTLRFLSEAHFMLRDATPIEAAAASEVGFDEVQDLLGRLHYSTGA